MCQQAKIRINPNAFLLWNRLQGTHGLSPKQYFAEVGFDYYKQLAKNSIEIARFIDSHPFTLNGKPFPVFIEMPCGHCSACLSQRVQTFQKRALAESLMSYHTAFATFTYDDEHLPKFFNCDTEESYPTLYKKDIQTMRHRVDARLSRLNEGDELYKLRYSMVYVGEYGGKGNRPHYHALYFFHTPLTPNGLSRVYEMFQQDWNCPYIIKVYKINKNGKRSINYSIVFPHLAPSNLTIEKQLENYQKQFTSYQSLHKEVICELAPNPFFKGFIRDFDIARTPEASAQYIMKYIGKWYLKTELKDKYQPLNTIKYGQYAPCEPFLQLPTKRALGNIVLDNEDNRQNILKSTDGSFYCRGIRTSRRLPITPQLKEELYPSWSRKMRDLQDRCYLFRVASSEVQRALKQFNYDTRLLPHYGDSIPALYHPLQLDDPRTPLTHVTTDVVYDNLDELLNGLNSKVYTHFNYNKLRRLNEKKQENPRTDYSCVYRGTLSLDNVIEYNSADLLPLSADISELSAKLRSNFLLALRYVATHWDYIDNLPTDEEHRNYVADRHSFFGFTQNLTREELTQLRENKTWYNLESIKRLTNNDTYYV